MRAGSSRGLVEDRTIGRVHDADVVAGPETPHTAGFREGALGNHAVAFQQTRHRHRVIAQGLNGLHGPEIVKDHLLTVIPGLPALPQHVDGHPAGGGSLFQLTGSHGFLDKGANQVFVLSFGGDLPRGTEMAGRIK